MCEIYAKASIFRIFVSNHKSSNFIETNYVTTYLSFAIFGFVYGVKKLSLSLQKSYHLLQKITSNYFYSKCQKYPSMNIVINKFWYIYTDIFDKPT